MQSQVTEAGVEFPRTHRRGVVTTRARVVKPLEAVVFDLDGVVTHTARVHRAAWKELFDEFLAARTENADEDHTPFTEEDYREQVDGKPRHEGIRAFLASRGIELPDGSRQDSSSAQTVHGLGLRKNHRFRDLVVRGGVDVDRGTLRLVRELRESGTRVGVATSSENGALILQQAGIDDLFDARVDGVVSLELRLRGKPHPDIFLECARRLGASSPARALVIEDAASGVSAAKAGGFGLVIGVDRVENWLRLRHAGADWIVRSMDGLSADLIRRYHAALPDARPNILSEWERVMEALRGQALVVFLDYDGTLTPIVDRPELAVLDPAMRSAVAELAECWPTQIVSGRGLEDIQRLVGIDGLWYAGNHGYDIAAPHGSSGNRQVAPDLEPEIHSAAHELRDATRRFPGVLIEDKRFSLSVHYRLVDEAHLPELESLVYRVAAGHPTLKKSDGKKLFELRPARDWDKGKALLWLLEATGQNNAFPIYLGDDTTDEDAFAVLVERGIGVLVTDLPRPTAARYSLQDSYEVRLFLERLARSREAK
jgi:trehalose-phosphatase